MIDENGYPGCRMEDGSFDGGDTASILGTLWMFGEFLEVELPWHSVAQVPIRHPDPTMWYSQPDRFSRDQLKAVLCGLCARSAGLEEHTVLLDTEILFRAHKKRYFLTAWNTKKNGAMDVPSKRPDLTGPTIWALWIRLLRPWWGKLVLPVLDLELLFSAIHWRLFRKDRVTRMHLLTSLAALRYSPTWVSWAVARINNWEDLAQRWVDHCNATGEYQTGHLFQEEIRKHPRLGR